MNMVEKVARAMCEAWHYAPIGSPDGDAEWKRKQDQYRKQARAAIEAFRHPEGAMKAKINRYIREPDGSRKADHFMGFIVDAALSEERTS